MSEIKDTVYINIEYFDGQDEDDVGYPYYVASSDTLHFVTDGRTLEELAHNISECLLLCLDRTE